MKFNKEQIDKIGHLTPNNIRNYLKTHDWTLYQTYPNDDASVWTKGDAFGRLLHNPAQYADYTEITARFLVTISDTDNIPLDTLIHILSSGNKDIIQFHISEPIAQDGTIELNRSVNLIQSVKNLIIAAASGADDLAGDITPKKIYPSKKTDRVSVFGDSLRLGQTAVGSYVITVEVDVTPHEDVGQRDLNNNIPMSFARRVNMTMATAIQALNDAYKEEQQNPEMTSESIISRTVRYGVSVNLCEALTELGMVSDGTYTSLGIDFKWASQYPVPIETPTAVAIPHSQMYRYADDVKYLKSVIPRFNEEYAGYVIKLDHPKDAIEGIATIATIIDNKRSRLKITLPALGSDASYYTAVKAHERSCMLKCVGDLHKKGRQYTLMNPHDIEILMDDECDEQST